MVAMKILGTLYFDPKLFEHKFKRIHFDTPQGHIDTNTVLLEK